MKKVKDGNEVGLGMGDEGGRLFFGNITENDFDYECIGKGISVFGKIYIDVIEVKKGFFTEDMGDGFEEADYSVPVHVKESLEEAKKFGHFVSHNKATIDTQTPDGGRKEYDKWVKAFEKKHIVNVKAPKKEISHS